MVHGTLASSVLNEKIENIDAVGKSKGSGTRLNSLMEAPVHEPQTPSSTDAEELHLLISELDDELARYRWREAVWVSLILHAIIFTVVGTAPKWLPGHIVIIRGAQQSKTQTPTFLALPKDLQHVKPPKTDIISDKNRMAQTRVPVLQHGLCRRRASQRCNHNLYQELNSNKMLLSNNHSHSNNSRRRWPVRSLRRQPTIQIHFGLVHPAL